MIDELRAKQIIDLFLEFVAKQQNGEKADFKSGYLLIHEGYKDGVYVRGSVKNYAQIGLQSLRE